MKKSLDSLKGQKEALQQRLKAVQDEIRKKEAAKAAREASQARKTRTHALILMGTLLEALTKAEQIPAEQLAGAATAYYAHQLEAAKKQPAKNGETPEKQARRIQKQIGKLERDRDLLIKSIKTI